MTDTATPTRQPAVVIEIDKREFTPEGRARTADHLVLQERLNSPSKKSTPEQIKSRMASAERRRLDFNEARSEKAHEFVKKVEEVRKKRTVENKENSGE